MSSLSLDELINGANRLLADAGVSPGPDAEILAARAFDIEVSRLRMQRAIGTNLSELSNDEAAALELFSSFIERRANREPLQHITGRAHFRTIELRVGPGVFVPRPETEVLVGIVLDAIADVESPTIVDLGSGSGAIALSIASERPDAHVTAVEGSGAAYPWLRQNAALIAPRVETLHGDFTLVRERMRGTVTVIVSNPPYVPEGMVPHDPEVRLFDPEAALYSGRDGLDAIRRISALGLELAAPSAWIALEHAEHQGEQVRAILSGDGWAEATTVQDLTGRDRCTIAKRSRSAAEAVAVDDPAPGASS
ncbi:peptide chain release factor N(5)-glutamine methyltransferase [Humidisolicoccus flavus]|uniref:peptide chain release factor N(5)-glutamine methyltransferase n=1 Tax=Humidisolicoccus flavus TaxID=3111414 RepID=UPI003254B0D6